MRLFGISLGIMMGLASPAATQSFDVPAGCQGFLTVQQQVCRVKHYFTCEGDPEGHRHIHTHTADGLIQHMVIDSHFNWVLVDFVGHARRFEVPNNVVGNDSLSILQRDGIYRFDDPLYDVMGDQRHAVRWIGANELTGQSRIIDGVQMLEVTHLSDFYDASGAIYAHYDAVQLLWPEYGLFLSWSWVDQGSGEMLFDRPIDLIFPGEPGFDQATPRYGCDALMSGLDQPDHAPFRHVAEFVSAGAKPRVMTAIPTLGPAPTGASFITGDQ